MNSGTIYFSASAERIFEVMARPKDGGDFCRLSFRLDDVAGVQEVNDKAAALKLRTGEVIPVAMDYAALRVQVYGARSFKDGPIIDLTHVTGESAQHIVAPCLADTFNANAGLAITAILRIPSTKKTFIHAFAEADVTQYAADTSNYSKSGDVVLIHFNQGARPVALSSASYSYAVLDMPYDDFIQALARAKKASQGELNLMQLFADKPQSYGLDA